MSSPQVGTVRSSQVITTYGPGSLVDLPKHSVIVAGLDTWNPKPLRQIVEPRLTAKIHRMTRVSQPTLYAPPPEKGSPWLGANSKPSHIGVRRFPEWFVVQRADQGGASSTSDSTGVSRRLVHLRQLEGERFERQPVVATRFVRACTNGHVDDLDWRHFVHSGHTGCREALWPDERGQSGDLGDLTVRCECGQRRVLSDAVKRSQTPLGAYSGKRP